MAALVGLPYKRPRRSSNGPGGSVGDIDMLRDKFLAVQRITAIDPLKVVAQRGLNPRARRLRPFRLIGHRPDSRSY
jgi:hypothetical protein